MVLTGCGLFSISNRTVRAVLDGRQMGSWTPLFFVVPGLMFWFCLYAWRVTGESRIELEDDRIRYYGAGRRLEVDESLSDVVDLEDSRVGGQAVRFVRFAGGGTIHISEDVPGFDRLSALIESATGKRFE